MAQFLIQKSRYVFLSTHEKSLILILITCFKIFVDAADESKSITASQAKTLIRQLIAGFRDHGLKKGDCVCICSFNSIYYPILILSIIGFGGIYTGTNPSYTAYELKHHLKASDAKLILTEPDILPIVQSAFQLLNRTQSSIFLLDSTSGIKPISPEPKIPSWRTLLAHGEQPWTTFSDLATATSTTAMLLFSSGTTGLPKPAILSHHNLIAQHTLAYETKPLRPYSASRIITLPLFHVGSATTSPISALRASNTNYIMRRFEVSAFLSHCEKYRPTDLLLVPPMVAAVLAHPMEKEAKMKALSGTRFGISGAAPLDKETQGRFQGLLPTGAAFTQGYGMTETTAWVAMFPYVGTDDTGSVGRMLPNIDFKIADEEGMEVKEVVDGGLLGELCVRGPVVVKGYVGVPRERDFDSEGFLRTGDVVKLDVGTGKLYVSDRKKEMIKVRGFQVAPAELEGILLGHPGIADAAVVGVKLEGGRGELPRAYVVKKEGKDGDALDEDGVKNWVRERLAKYKALDGGVRFIEVIPKSASGKILRRVIREMADKEKVGEKAKL